MQKRKSRVSNVVCQSDGIGRASGVTAAAVTVATSARRPTFCCRRVHQMKTAVLFGLIVLSATSAN